MSGKQSTVLLVASNFPPIKGGSAVVYDNLARSAGGRITVLAPRVAYPDGLSLIGWREHDRRAVYRVHRLTLLRTRLDDGALRPGLAGVVRRAVFLVRDMTLRVWVAGAILRLIRREKHRIVCVGELLASGWLIQLISKFPGIRVIAYVHGEEITTTDSYDTGRARCQRALRAADGVVVVSRFTRSAVLDLIGSDTSPRVHLIENGVDSTRFVPGPKRPDLVARYRIAGQFVFVSVCRILEKKGIDHALRAFASLKLPNCRFLVVGAGPFMGALRELVDQLDIRNEVVFVGQVTEEDLVDHYRLGDVFVMPNRELSNHDTEGFGLVFLEANGCGLPVIAGRDGGSTDAVRDGANGLVVDGRSVTSIATAMRRLFEDAALRQTLSRAGLESARQANWSDKARSFLAFCENLDDASGAGRRMLDPDRSIA